MRLRRYYMKGVKYPYTINDSYLKKLVIEKGEVEAALIDNANYEIILESEEEEKKWFFECLQRVQNNTRYYLNNIDKLPVFKVHIRKIFPKKKG